MKNILLTILIALSATAAIAQQTSYTDTLAITVNETDTYIQEVTINVENNEEKYTLSLNDFIIIDGEDRMPVGNIVVTDITMTENKGIKEFETTQEITIAAGNGEENWFGPMLKELTLNIKGEMTEEKLHFTLDLDLTEKLGEIISIVFGKEIEIIEEKVISYTDQLITNVGKEVVPAQEATITIEKVDSTYTLYLEKFTITYDNEVTHVGNIVITDIVMTNNDDVKEFETEQHINITAGDDRENWIGPMCDEIFVKLKGTIREEQLNCTIDFELNGLPIGIVFGEIKDDSSNEEDNVGKEEEEESIRSYTDQLVISINEQTTEPLETTIIVEYKNGVCTLALKNFALGEQLPVGDIVVTDIAVTNNNGIKEFETTQNIVIAESEGVAGCIGPGLGELPVSLKGKMTNDKLYCTIMLDLVDKGLGIINVIFGEDIESGIENIVADDNNAMIFDLSGRSIKAVSTPGIYIINGKKVLVR